MRNRTEMVSNTGSDYDENEGEFEADDGSDDWKPEPEVSKLTNLMVQNCYFSFECVCGNGGIKKETKITRANGTSTNKFVEDMLENYIILMLSLSTKYFS